MSRSVRGVAALVMAAAVVVGCSPNKAAGPGDGVRTPRVTTTNVPPAPPPVFALTGRPAPDADTAARPALSIRIDDSDALRPRAGIGGADVVFEDVIEKTRTGLFAVYQSDDADVVGPVGPLQTIDPLLLVPLHGLMAHVGGRPEQVDLLKAEGVTDLARSRAPEAFKKREGRKPPNDLFTSTNDLRERTPVDARPPDPLFVFRHTGDPVKAPGAVPLARLIVHTGTANNPTFTWDDANKRWILADGDKPRLAEGNKKLYVENVIVQLVTYTKDHAELVGSGDILVGTGGQLVRGQWVRSRPAIATRWVDAAGNDMLLDPGRTWVLIMATTTPIDTIGALTPTTAPG